VKENLGRSKDCGRGDIPLEKHVRRSGHFVYGQDNIGNVCGTGLAPASSLHRVPCVYYD
jgi:hypothetical protein